MNIDKLQKAFNTYKKSEDTQKLADTLKEIILYMAKDALRGHDIRFVLYSLPIIVDFLLSVDLKKHD